MNSSHDQIKGNPRADQIEMGQHQRSGTSFGLGITGAQIKLAYVEHRAFSYLTLGQITVMDMYMTDGWHA